MDAIPVELSSRQAISLRVVTECHRLDIQTGHSIIRSQPQVSLPIFSHTDNCIIRQPVTCGIVFKDKVIILVTRQLIQSASIATQPDSTILVFQNAINLFQLC